MNLNYLNMGGTSKKIYRNLPVSDLLVSFALLREEREL